MLTKIVLTSVVPRMKRVGDDLPEDLRREAPQRRDGAWSLETRELLADGDALAAYKRRAFGLYRRRFAPEALLRRVDAWNERGAPDGWQDS